MGENKKAKFYKGKGFWIHSGVVVVVFFAAYIIGAVSMSTTLDGEKVKHGDLLVKSEDIRAEIVSQEEKVEELMNRIDSLNEEKGKLKEQITANEHELEEALTLIENKKSTQEEISKLDKEKASKTEEINQLKGQLKSKEQELAVVSGKIIEKKEEPKTLAAGFYTVGKDIPASRYKVTPNGDGNFFVNDGAKVNILLGNDSFFESEYVFYADEGDEIELTISANFIPIE